ncbi:protein FAM228A isoform X3 [Triplophysa rosa]|uniref:protein FAM228A isoform X3 n=1 Tax=Triplophysa rosa TaxID=992332 RepID=UPI002545F619|nr:protein FAM228A isoform X3 [Triplophysa rosa]
MARTRTNDDMQYTFSVSSKKQLMEQLHSEQKEAYSITQPLLETETGFIKGFVFLETYDPSEYNPFLHHFNRPQHHKVLTPPLQDPLSLQSRGMIKEKMAILCCQTGCVYHHRRVDECSQSLPVSQHSLTKPHAKPSGDTASERLWGDNSRWGSRRQGTPCVSTADGRCFQPQCWSSRNSSRHVLPL